jgi:hypothetical protein
MVICSNCGSRKVTVNNGNFAARKREGQPSQKHTHNTYYFYCHDCEEQWESDPQAERDFFEYSDLEQRTRMRVRDHKPGGGHGTPPNIQPSDIPKRREKSLLERSLRHTDIV